MVGVLSGFNCTDKQRTNAFEVLSKFLRVHFETITIANN